VSGFTDHRTEVDIQRDDEIASSGNTQTLSGQGQGRIHRSCGRGECAWGKGGAYS